MEVRQHLVRRIEPLITSDEMQELLAISSHSDAEVTNEKKFDTHHFYMQFLMHSQTQARKKPQKELGLTEQHLLEKIAVRCAMDKPISVREICAMRHFGSSSNIHYILHKLKELGMIFLHCSDEDGHIKKINLAPSGVAYFQEVEDRIDMALKI